MIFKKVIEHKICVLNFSVTLIWNLAHPKKKWTRYDRKYVGFRVKYPLFLSDFSELEFFDTFSKSIKMSNFLKISPLGAEFFHADGQTDMTKLIVALRNFAKAPKKKW